MTRNEADAAELPVALVTQVQETITAIRRTEKTIGERQADVLTTQAGMTEQRSRLRALREEIAREVELRQLDLLRLDSPSLWTAFGDSQNADLGEQVLAAAQVIELLTEVARAHAEVLKDPEPAAIFTGWGDSSLDFEIRAWTTGDFVAIASDLRVGIDQTLAEHGIQIPCPQRDLHLRNADAEALAKLAGSEVSPGTE